MISNKWNFTTANVNTERRLFEEKYFSIAIVQYFLS